MAQLKLNKSEIINFINIYRVYECLWNYKRQHQSVPPITYDTVPSSSSSAFYLPLLRNRVAEDKCLLVWMGTYELTLAPPTPDKMAHCIFCDIVAGHSPSTILELETDEYVIFKDIKPASTYHYLCVPKRHIESIKTMTKDYIPLIYRMEAALKGFYQSKGIYTEDALFGFHMPPCISVNHLHMHGIAPRSAMSWKNRHVFWPSSPWFNLVQDAREYLENKS